MAPWTKLAVLLAILGLTTSLAFAVVTGSISGTARDPEGAVVPGVTVEARNVETGVVNTLQTDAAGFYHFASLPIGHYDVTFKKAGFANFEQTNETIDVDTAAQVDAALKVGSAATQTITVSSTTAQIDTENAQMGEVIGGKEMENLPLNGRAYTDLLGLQPGVVPISTALFGNLSPDNQLNGGLVSMSGAQDVHSGFMIDGANVTEGYEGGTYVMPTLDSLAEFRIVTNNGQAEYGNYSGGLVNVVTKSGTNQFHGDAFEFYRNTNLDAACFFCGGTRGVLTWNQYGGTLGGPIWRNKMFFFGDYQGWKENQGVQAGPTLVPSAADKTGNLSDQAALFDPVVNGVVTPTTVNGTYWASVLSSRLGYTVNNLEPYYTPGCTSATCVFPGAQIPQAAWDPVAASIMAAKLIPDPNYNGTYFETTAYPETLTDNKGGVSVDLDNTRVGSFRFYYHLDPWSNPQPYPGWGGSTVPGFPGTTEGKAELYVASLTTRFGSSAVNVFTASAARNKNILGISASGPSPSSLGYADPAVGGLYPEAGTQYQNYPSISLNHYNLGPANSVVAQFDNTYQGQDDFTKIVGTHSFKFGGDYHWDQVDIGHPNNGGNGGFSFNGQETGYDFADMLLGATNSFYQGAAAALHLRSYYTGVYAEDSWRASRDLTLNYGVRWEVQPYWYDSHNRNPVVLLGVQSTTFPTAPTGYLFPGESGVPKTLTFTRWDNFAPRLGIAYAPDVASGIGHKLLGDHGKSSIRLGWGMYYTNIQGYNTFNFASAPYALFYGSPQPPMMFEPYVDRASGHFEGQKFPVPPVVPSAIDWTKYEPIGGKSNPTLHDPTPYEEHFDLSFERQLNQNTVATVAYVGTFGRHLVVSGDNNPGNAALCLSLSDPSEVVPGTQTCGPNDENATFYPIGGGQVNGTRGPFGALFEANSYEMDVSTSSYSAMEASLRHTSGRLSLLLAYTFSHAMDYGSGSGDQILTYGDHGFYHALSVYDLPQIFSASYTYELPFDYLFKKDNNLTRGWKLSGITQLTDGTPIQISEYDDHDLRGDSGNIFYGSTDEPNFVRGLSNYYDRNPRDVQPYLNTAQYTLETPGTIGNSPRRMLHGPGMESWDMSLLKDVQIREAMSAEFRAEFFGVFNHASFIGSGGGVDGSILDGANSFGYDFNSSGARVGQLAVKFYF
jgi:hypothetical protein